MQVLIDCAYFDEEASTLCGYVCDSYHRQLLDYRSRDRRTSSNRRRCAYPFFCERYAIARAYLDLQLGSARPSRSPPSHSLDDTVDDYLPSKVFPGSPSLSP